MKFHHSNRTGHLSLGVSYPGVIVILDEPVDGLFES